MLNNLKESLVNLISDIKVCEEEYTELLTQTGRIEFKNQFYNIIIIKNEEINEN